MKMQGFCAFSGHLTEVHWLTGTYRNTPTQQSFTFSHCQGTVLWETITCWSFSAIAKGNFALVFKTWEMQTSQTMFTWGRMHTCSYRNSWTAAWQNFNSLSPIWRDLTQSIYHNCMTAVQARISVLKRTSSLIFLYSPEFCYRLSL